MGVKLPSGLDKPLLIYRTILVEQRYLRRAMRSCDLVSGFLQRLIANIMRLRTDGQLDKRCCGADSQTSATNGQTVTATVSRQVRRCRASSFCRDTVLVCNNQTACIKKPPSETDACLHRTEQECGMDLHPEAHKPVLRCCLHGSLSSPLLMAVGQQPLYSIFPKVARTEPTLLQAAGVIGSIGPVQPSTLTFPGGAKMPLIGFGTYKVDKADSVRYTSNYGLSTNTAH